MIKYQWSKDENDNLVDINHLDESSRKRNKYFCISCGNELIAKLGKIKKHHFAHKNEVNCSKETYLHLLGKKLFYDSYTECLTTKKPFYI
jgi:competence CoiA-like predicted nuclease